mmetsp:Transcript_121243/g.304844  ORF Transcript_121243/g.304844 Transcript_121243/m.304844 type:complete len:119 (-) Transcript_121243:396-752(-)
MERRAIAQLEDIGLCSSEPFHDRSVTASGDAAAVVQRAARVTSASGAHDRAAALVILAKECKLSMDDLVEAIKVDPRSVEDVVTQLICTGGSGDGAWSRAELCLAWACVLEDHSSSSK